MTISPQKRTEVLDALRRGTVPRSGLENFAVGLDRFAATIEQELTQVSSGGSVFKAVRGEYGCGKTFFARWIQSRAQRLGFVTSEVQISETETPLHKLETVYRRMIERLSSNDQEQGAFRSLLDSWFFALEEDVLSAGTIDGEDTNAILQSTNELLEKRLQSINRSAPAFAMALRGYRSALAQNDAPVAGGILAWLGGQPNVSASAKKTAGIKGEVDHFAALGFVQGLLAVLRDSGRPGLLLVLDEVETLQRMRGDVREKALNALRQLVDEIDGGRFPGLYLIITGTPSFFDSPQGVQKLAPLAQRLQVDFSMEARFDNPRAVQIRLTPFDQTKLVEVGIHVRDIFARGAEDEARVRAKVGDPIIKSLAAAVGGKLGGKVGVAPRIFLKKLVADILDRVDQFPDFDPSTHYALSISKNELSEAEMGALPASSIDDIDIKT